jgi:acetyltransferase-like isoleucine patch superfamily enzyme
MKIKKFNNGSYIIGKNIEIGENFKIGSNTIIRATNCIIGNNVNIGDNNNFLVGEHLALGSNTLIGSLNNVTGRVIDLGQYVYWDHGVTVGHGGKFSPNSKLLIGSYTMICAKITLNLSDSIKIGTNVGLGEEVQVWTHGAYLPILEGFPADFGPVEIGNNVWLPSRSIVLPNRKIGNNVVVGINSVINRNIPDGALAAGIPIKILKENIYPDVDHSRNKSIIFEIIEDYKILMTYKEISSKLRFIPEQNIIICNGVKFDLNTMDIVGELGAEEQDFRDYMRRRGIKFFNGDPFSSILPREYANLLNVKL